MLRDVLRKNMVEKSLPESELSSPLTKMPSDLSVHESQLKSAAIPLCGPAVSLSTFEELSRVPEVLPGIQPLHSQGLQVACLLAWGAVLPALSSQ